MVPTSQLALADVLGLDICRVVDSFRPVLVFGAAVPRRRAELDLAQRRCIALRRKREATLRFDVEIPPYPGHASSLPVGVVSAKCCISLSPGSGDLDDANQWIYAPEAAVLFQWFRRHYQC